MSDINFMSYDDALSVLDEYANAIKSSKPRLVGSSSTTGTYSNKIDELYPYYNALTVEEKLRAVIVQNDQYIYQITDIVTASFTKLTSFQNGSSTTDENVIITMQQSGSSVWKFQVGAGTTTNASGTTNDLVFKLYLR